MKHTSTRERSNNYNQNEAESNPKELKERERENYIVQPDEAYINQQNNYESTKYTKTTVTGERTR